MGVRDADRSEVDLIARIWHDGWHEAHARLFPGALVRDRNLENLTARLRAAPAPRPRSWRMPRC